jgi:hypothetical protein
MAALVWKRWGFERGNRAARLMRGSRVTMDNIFQSTMSGLAAGLRVVHIAVLELADFGDKTVALVRILELDSAAAQQLREIEQLRNELHTPRITVRRM